MAHKVKQKTMAFSKNANKLEMICVQFRNKLLLFNKTKQNSLNAHGAICVRL